MDKEYLKIIKKIIDENHWVFDPVLNCWLRNGFNHDINFDFNTLECIRSFDKYCMSFFFDKQDNALILETMGFKEVDNVFHLNNLRIKTHNDESGLHEFNTDQPIYYKELLKKITKRKSRKLD